jgi:hypothetical protein
VKYLNKKDKLRFRKILFRADQCKYWDSWIYIIDPRAKGKHLCMWKEKNSVYPASCDGVCETFELEEEG